MSSFVVRLMLAGTMVLAAGVVSFAKKTENTPPVCRQDEKIFRGKCVSPGECCVTGACDSGDVFEFGDDGPRCVPCGKVDTQQAMNFCATAATVVAERDLDIERKAFLKRFPQRAARIIAVEKAWEIFRERSCNLETSEYEGGSMQPQVHGQCMARETKLHLERLRALRTEWSRH